MARGPVSVPSSTLSSRNSLARRSFDSVPAWSTLVIGRASLMTTFSFVSLSSAT